jgi:hypothetical protein
MKIRSNEQSIEFLKPLNQIRWKMISEKLLPLFFLFQYQSPPLSQYFCGMEMERGSCLFFLHFVIEETFVV